MNTFWEFVRSVPDAIWGAIWGAFIGSGLTLVGVGMTNRHSLKQQKQQFTFESQERQRERLVILRRDVYLPAMNAVAGMGAALGRLANTDPSNEEITKHGSDFAAALARVQLVCSPDTLRLVSELHRAYLVALVEMQKRKIPMMLRASEINIANGSRDNYDAERKKCIELMKEYNLAGVHDEHRWNTIVRRAEKAGEHWSEAHREWTRLTLEQETARLELLKDFVQKLRALTQVQAPAMAAIRAELESTASADILAEEAEKTAQVGMAGIGEMIPILEATLEAMRRDAAASEANGDD